MLSIPSGASRMPTASAAQLLEPLQRRAQGFGHFRLGVDPGLLDPQQRAVDRLTAARQQHLADVRQ